MFYFAIGEKCTKRDEFFYAIGIYKVLIFIIYS